MITGSRGSLGKDSEGVTRGLYAASIPVLPFETKRPGIQKSASEIWSRVSVKLTSDKTQQREISVRMTGVLGRRCIRVVVTEFACHFLYCPVPYAERHITVTCSCQTCVRRLHEARSDLLLSAECRASATCLQQNAKWLPTSLSGKTGLADTLN